MWRISKKICSVDLTPSADVIRGHLLSIYDAALTAVHGHSCVSHYLQEHPVTGPVYVIAMGKAAAAMMSGAVETLGSQIQDAFIVTKRGHGQSFPWSCHEAGHPLPDESSLECGDRLVQFAQGIPESARVLVLLSGGASALVEKLPEGIQLEDLIRINAWLLGSGWDIARINQVRKRFSLLKGGRLASVLAPRPVLCLAISDVPNDDPAAIGSGMLSCDPEEIVGSDLPAFIRALLPRLPKTTPVDTSHVKTEIIASLSQAKQAAVVAAQALDYEVVCHDEFIGGDVRQAGERLNQCLQSSDAGLVHVWGGETTVSLPTNPGRGGRNQSLALCVARYIAGKGRAWFLAAGSDGTDGPGNDAGALVDHETLKRGQATGFDSADALIRADAGTFLEASGDLIHTGPTGTNVMDIMLGLRLDQQRGSRAPCA